MAKEIRPYDISEINDLVEDAKQRYRSRHDWFRSLESLYRTGKSMPLGESTVTGTVFERLHPADLETINMVLPHLNIILASVVARDPKPIAVPYQGGEEAEINAKVAEAVASYYWMRTSATSVLRDMAQDMVVLGNGFCKVGWKHSVVEEPRPQEAVEEDLNGVVRAEMTMAISEGREVGSIEKMLEYVPLTERRVEADEPFVEYVSPYDIFFPMNARRLEETRWVAQRVILPIDEIKANPTFSNLDTVVADGLHDIRERDTGRNDTSVMEPMIYETATIYEFYDLRTRTLTVFQLGSDKPLYRGDIPYTHRYAPFVHMRNFADGGLEIWSFGDLENIASLQEKMNETFTEQVDNMRRAGNKYVTIRGLFDSESRDRLESDEPDVVIEMEPMNGLNPRDAITVLPRAPLPADIYGAQGKFEDAMRQVLGINDFQAGGLGADRMSAYAAAVVDGVATLRAKDKQQSVEKAAANVFNQIIRLCQEFMVEERAIRLVGVNGGFWEEIDQNVLRGEFDMRVEGGSLSAVNPATKQGRAIEMLNAVVPALVNFGYDVEPAMRHIVRELGYDPDQFLVKTPPPAPAPAAEIPAGEALPLELAGLAPEVAAPVAPQEGLSPEEQLAQLLAGPMGGEIPPGVGQAPLI
jgi:hypothetical protein